MTEGRGNAAALPAAERALVATSRARHATHEALTLAPTEPVRDRLVRALVECEAAQVALVAEVTALRAARG